MQALKHAGPGQDDTDLTGIQLFLRRRSVFLLMAVFVLLGLSAILHVDSGRGAVPQDARSAGAPQLRVPTYGPTQGTATAAELVSAMDIGSDVVVSASLGSSDPVGAHVFATGLGGYFTHGGSFAALLHRKCAQRIASEF